MTYDLLFWYTGWFAAISSIVIVLRIRHRAKEWAALNILAKTINDDDQYVIKNCIAAGGVIKGAKDEDVIQWVIKFSEHLKFRNEKGFGFAESNAQDQRAGENS